MKKCLSVLFVLVVLSINNCGGGSEEQTYLATPSGEEEAFVAECEDHPDCYPDHSICVSGVCTGDPQPENLPEENVPATGGEDATTATETSQGSGPWGNPNYNGSADSFENNEQGKEDSSDNATDTNNSSSGDTLESSPDTASDVNECENNSDCDDSDDCTFNSCFLGQCGYTQLWSDECGGEPDMPDNSLCMMNIDCDDNNECTDDICSDGLCEHVDGLCVQGEPACETDADCDDNDALTTDICWVGECFHAAVDVECYAGDSCDDKNGCTTDYCDKGLCNHDDKCVDLGGEAGTMLSCKNNTDCAGSKFGNYCYYGYCYPCINASYQYVACDDPEQVCTWQAVATDSTLEDEVYIFKFECITPECKTNQDCDDSDICTNNMCAYPYCINVKINNCVKCKADNDCTKSVWCDDKDGGVYLATGICSFYMDNPDGICEIKYSSTIEDSDKYNCPKPIECSEESDCPGGQCVNWYCYYENGQYPDCINDLDCDDNNACTTDYCDKSLCNHVAKDGCKTCETQADCNDGNVCTIDSCVDATLTCSHINNCQYAGSWTKLSCETDADCAGSGLGEFCVYSQNAGSGLCQECSNLSDNSHPCATGKICKWGIVGEQGNMLSHYYCENECNCDDANACTTDTCNANGACLHEPMEYCEPCKVAADCDESFVGYFCEDVNYQTTYGAFKCAAGICSQTISAVKCKYGCANSSCNECAVDYDCDDKNTTTIDSCVFPTPPVGAKECAHESSELKCSFSSCPDTLQSVVIWYGNNQTATVKCDGAELFKIYPEILCLWGTKNPTFKYNLWNGSDAWSSGGEAQVNCSQATTVTPDPNLGSGVQVVVFTDLLCEF